MSSETAGLKLDYGEILQLLPHRPPFILVDRVELLVPDTSIHAIKCVSGLDPHFQGHFPDMAILPGVLIIEGLAQASGILAMKSRRLRGEAVEAKCMLTGVENARFRKPVLPGDVLHYHARLTRARGNFAWFDGHAEVDGAQVAEVSFSALIGSFTAAKGAQA